MSGAGRARPRGRFNQAAELYDRARPGYPPALSDELARVAAVGPGCRVLEIGCGPGRPPCRWPSGLPGSSRSSSARPWRRSPGATWPASPRSRWPWPRSKTGRCRPSRSVVVAATAWHWLDPGGAGRQVGRGAAAGQDAGHGRDPSRGRWRRGLLHQGAGRYSAGTYPDTPSGGVRLRAAVAHDRTNWTTRPVRAGRLPPLRPGPGVHDRRVSGSAPIVFGERVTGRHRVRLSSAAIEVAARYANPHRCTRAGRTTQSRAHQDQRSAVIVGFALETNGRAVQLRVSSDGCGCIHRPDAERYRAQAARSR